MVLDSLNLVDVPSPSWGSHPANHSGQSPAFFRFCNLPTSFSRQGLFTCCSICLKVLVHALLTSYSCSFFRQVATPVSQRALPGGSCLNCVPLHNTVLRSHCIYLFSYLLAINCLYRLQQFLRSPEYYHHY